MNGKEKLITVNLSERTLDMAESCLWEMSGRGERNPEIIQALRELMTERDQGVTDRRTLPDRLTKEFLLLKMRYEIGTRGIY